MGRHARRLHDSRQTDGATDACGRVLLPPVQQAAATSLLRRAALGARSRLLAPVAKLYIIVLHIHLSARSHWVFIDSWQQ